MRMRVVAPGFLTTVQDLGRFGYGELGVSAAGAADPLSLRLGNRLLGNPEGAPALEMTLAGGRFRFEAEAVVALTGADFGGSLDGEPAARWSPLAVRAGQTLSFGPTRDGARAYLCLRGGIDVPLVLGSASTHLPTGIGGVQGRPLRAGDVLPLGPPAARSPLPPLHPERVAALHPRGVLRITPGAQADWFGPEGHALLLDTRWRVLEGSDRTGLRLSAPSLPRSGAGELLTEGAPLGAIQAPPAAGPIVLCVDHQTTGGYPKIGNVIAADLPLLGQLRPRDEIRFEPIDLEAARALLLRQEQEIDALFR